VDLRIIAATNRDLRAVVNEKRFRADLHDRLAVTRITLRALRERREDVAPLVEAILKRLGVSQEAGDVLRSPEAIRRAPARPGAPLWRCGEITRSARTRDSACFHRERSSRHSRCLAARTVYHSPAQIAVQGAQRSL
jgi:sigma54-dependent transcription regulator